MALDRPDPFARFAARCGVQISKADLSAVPRDVLAQPTDLTRHTLVTLTVSRAGASSVQTLFLTEASDPRPVTVRDVLWWLSSDSWAIEQADRDFTRWAAVHRYRAEDPATLRLFTLHVEQADALTSLLGDAAYRESLRLYESEIETNP